MKLLFLIKRGYHIVPSSSTALIKGNENAGRLSEVFDRVIERQSSELDEASSELDEESSGLKEESSGLEEKSSGLVGKSSGSNEDSSGFDEKRKIINGGAKWFVESELFGRDRYDGHKKIVGIKRVLYVTETELQAEKHHRNFVNFARMEEEEWNEAFRIKYCLDEDDYDHLLELDDRNLDFQKRYADFLIKASKIKFKDFSASVEVKNLMEKIKNYKPTEIILDLAPYGKSPDTDILNKTYLLSNMIKKEFPHLCFD